MRRPILGSVLSCPERERKIVDLKLRSADVGSAQKGSSLLTIGRRTAGLPLLVAQIASFSALIAAGTTVLRIPAPAPLFEITLAPVFYLAISVLFPRRVSFWSTVLGSAIGEAVNVAVYGGLLIYVPGIVWARAPEALIIYRFRNGSLRVLVIAMVLATVYETLAFFIPDWLFYSLALFSYSDAGPQGLAGGFASAFSDLFTMVDLLWIPVAIGAVVAVRKAFRTRFLD